MNIGQLARQAGVPIDTIRYYERQHLLRTAERSPAGYRIFDAGSLARLQFIRRAKALGFSLDDIAELLSLSEASGGDMAAVREAALTRLNDIDRRIAELQRMRDGLASVIKRCPGHGDLEVCPILAALQHPEPTR